MFFSAPSALPQRPGKHQEALGTQWVRVPGLGSFCLEKRNQNEIRLLMVGSPSLHPWSSLLSPRWPTSGISQAWGISSCSKIYLHAITLGTGCWWFAYLCRRAFYFTLWLFIRVPAVPSWQWNWGSPWAKMFIFQPSELGYLRKKFWDTTGAWILVYLRLAQVVIKLKIF